MIRRTLLACSLLLACGLGLTLWFLTGAGGELRGAGRLAAQEIGLTTAHAPSLASATPATTRGAAVEALAQRREAPLPRARSTMARAYGVADELPLPEPRTVEVLVQDEQGHPIEGADVRASGVSEVPADEDLPDGGSLSRLITETTDALGLCTLESVRPRVRIHAAAAGFTHDIAYAGEGPRTTLELRPGLAITGRVLDSETLAPITGALVRISDTCRGCVQNWTETDEMGRFTGPVTPLGQRVRVRTQAPGFLTERSSFRLRGATSARADVVLRRGAEVWLEFFDLETGAPLSGVRVKGRITLRTDARGLLRSAALVGADEQDLSLTARLSEYATVWFSLGAANLSPLTPLRIPMARERTLTGLVRDPSGNPLYKARLIRTDRPDEHAEQLWYEQHQAAFAEGPSRLRFAFMSDVHNKTRSDGEYRFPHLEPWTRAVRLRVEHPGYVQASWRIQLDPGRDPTWREWTLTPTAERGPAEPRATTAGDSSSLSGRR